MILFGMQPNNVSVGDSNNELSENTREMSLLGTVFSYPFVNLH